MNSLQVGFAAVNIDPPLGIPVRGYYVPRRASGILRSIEIRMIALSAGQETFTEKEIYVPSTGRYEKGREKTRLALSSWLPSTTAA